MSPRSRRDFLKQSLLVAGASAIFPRMVYRARAQEEAPTAEDHRIVQQKFDLAEKESLQTKPIGEVMKAIGMSFLGTSYAPHILEETGEEHLVINLRGLDCVSFTENTLALSRCVKMGTVTFEAYKEQMQLIRYRGGIINRYPSRLHYFSDWIDDNVKKGILRDITRKIGGQRYRKTINYMTTHRSDYRQLSDESFFRQIGEMERELTARVHYYVPKGRLRSHQRWVQSGDIIAITSALDGMDIAHTGVAVRLDGVLKFMHAPLPGAEVQVTEKPLVEYLQLHKKHTGVMVARPLEPRG
jgi:hypothetical protein